MTTLIWSPQSLRDLESICEYIARESPATADLVLRKIVSAVQRLVPFPKSGRIVPERNDSDIREVIVPPYRVVYRLRGDVVEIATIFRGSRAFPEPLE